MEKLPFTEIGLNKLKKEMSDLKSIERPAVIKAIAEARSHGDLSENAEYHAARERQGFIEGRLLELENVISRAEIIDLNNELIANEQHIVKLLNEIADLTNLNEKISFYHMLKTNI